MSDDLSLSQTHPHRRLVGLGLGPALLVLTLLLPAPAGLSPDAWKTAGVAFLMISWWVSETVPIPVTALLPLICFPLLGILDMGAAAAPYANPVIFLFLGGFLLARAVKKWGLHRRAALFIVARAGTQPARLVGGFMLASALLSMWISNTATTIMMLPIGVSLIGLLERAEPHHARHSPTFGIAIMLGTAYGASIGGWVEQWLPGLTDTGIAIAAAILLFALPVYPTRGEYLLDWKTAEKLLWGVLLLAGGGLSLAAPSCCQWPRPRMPSYSGVVALPSPRWPGRASSSTWWPFC
jgi:di/tricarboxylate transporter